MTTDLKAENAIPIGKALDFPDLAGMMDAYWGGRRKKYPVRSLHASKIGHPCIRFHVYNMTQWERAKEIPISLQRIFELGSRIGQDTVTDIQNALAGSGWELVCQEMRLPENQYGIAGMVDGMLRNREKAAEVPIEIKSCSPHVWDGLKTIEDFLHHDRWYIRAYPAQLEIYMLMTNQEWGVFCLRNKVTAEDRFIWIHLDLQYAEGLLQVAECVKEGVAKYRADPGEKSMPDRIQYDKSVCGECAFSHICVPDILQAPGVIDGMNAKEMEINLRRRAELEDAAKEFDVLDKAVKATAKEMAGELKPKEKRTVLTPGFEITITCGETTKFDIPDDVKAKYAHKEPSYRVKIESESEPE